jgi:hypothetical protein
VSLLQNNLAVCGRSPDPCLRNFLFKAALNIGRIAGVSGVPARWTRRLTIAYLLKTGVRLRFSPKEGFQGKHAIHNYEFSFQTPLLDHKPVS